MKISQLIEGYARATLSGAFIGGLLGFFGTCDSAMESGITIAEAGPVRSVLICALAGMVTGAIIYRLRQFARRGRWAHYLVWAISGALGVSVVVAPEALATQQWFFFPAAVVLGGLAGLTIAAMIQILRNEWS